MAGKTRSPNYPSMSLSEAIEAVSVVYSKERRSRFPRASLALHLGYSGLNGRALAKIGALRAYGLIEGKEDALSVSSTAIALLEAPKTSEDYIEALHIAYNAPPLFGRILSEHGDETPSPQTLRWWLSKQGYVGEAADKALKVYLASAELVNSVDRACKGDATEEHEEIAEKPLERTSKKLMTPPLIYEKPAGSPYGGKHGEQMELAMGVQERVLQSGMLSKQASYRVIVSGPVGVAEIDRLLKKLEMDKEILADTSPSLPDTSHEPDYHREWEEAERDG